jgi:hypothetical protein
MWDTGCDMPTQTASGMTKCFCGVIIYIKTSGGSLCMKFAEPRPYADRREGRAPHYRDRRSSP